MQGAVKTEKLWWHRCNIAGQFVLDELRILQANDSQFLCSGATASPQKDDSYLTVKVTEYQYENSLNWTTVPAATFLHLQETTSSRTQFLFT
jgi:hypothetical protein